jgi:hypothetical protein
MKDRQRYFEGRMASQAVEEAAANQACRATIFNKHMLTLSLQTLDYKSLLRETKASLQKWDANLTQVRPPTHPY